MQSDLAKKSSAYPFLAGGGETGELIRSIDWSKTSLGNPDQWPQSLKTCVRIILTSRQPMFVWWGKDLINIYNDAYIGTVRGKHPEALGQPATHVWSEIWDQLGPRADTVMRKNEGTYDEALLLIMERNGYPEETYYTFSYSPVPDDDGGTSGIICANTDDTERIIVQRQLTTLKDLGKAIIDCKNNEEVFRKTVDVLRDNPYDFPYAFFYGLDPASTKVNLISMSGADTIPPGIPLQFDIHEDQATYPSFLQAAVTGKPQLVKGLSARFSHLPRGAWKVPPDQALVLPITQSGQKQPHGFLSIGVNPFRLLDERYISFFQLIADQVSTALANVQSGADDYLAKPFSATELSSRIHSSTRLAQPRNNAAGQLHHLFMQAPVSICIIRGRDQIVELANEGILKIWGKSEDIVGLPLMQAMPELQGTPYPALLMEVYEKGITHHANESSAYLVRNGEPELVYFNFTYQPLYELDGTISGVLVAANEVTEQVGSRKKVEDAEERLRMAAEGTGLGTWDLNLQTRNIIYSQRLNEIFGHPRDYVMSHEKMRSQIHPDDIHSIVEKAFDRAMSDGHYTYEARVVWDNGTIRWIRTRGKVLYNDAGEPVRMLGTMLEITVEKEAEIKLRESEERYRQLALELEMRVAERTKDLSEANENLARSNKELEQFAFVTSHDLQEPLRKIQTFGNMLHDTYAEALTDKGKSYLNKMLTASQRMSKLINDLLNFSRLRQSEEAFIQVDLNEVMANVRNDFELVINRKRAVISQSQLPVIEANPLQMNQLFYNLLSNALKFTQDGQQPRISVSSRLLSDIERDQFSSLSKNCAYYELVFTDSGIGFAQEYAEKIFEIFQRLNARAEYEGTGIGLALVNKIMENHKGLVFAESKEQNGASFHIILPATQ